MDIDGMGSSVSPKPIPHTTALQGGPMLGTVVFPIRTKPTDIKKGLTPLMECLVQVHTHTRAKQRLISRSAIARLSLFLLIWKQEYVALEKVSHI